MGVTMANNPGMSPDDIVEYAQLAESLGFEAFWLTEDNIRDVFVTLDRIGQATERIRIGTGLTSIYARTPATLAMSSATLQNYSGGRFFLTVGLGGTGFVTRGHGVTVERPVVRMREAVEIVRLLIRGERVSYDGDFFTIDSFHIREPAAEEVSVYIGALNPKMTRLAGEIADGVLANFLTVNRLEDKVRPWLAEGRSAGERQDAEPLVATLALAPPADSKAPEAVAPLRRRVAFYGASPHYRGVLADAGYGEEADAIREAWLRGDQAGAVELVSTQMAEDLTLAGDDDKLSRHLAAYDAAGIYPVIYPVPRKDQMTADFRSAITRVAECASAAGLGKP
ncbi:MAG: LLM class flavin-dependent oxidoreductase [Thermoleophilaceae bacterium]